MSDSELAFALQERIEELEAHNKLLRQEMLDAGTQTCSTIFGKPYGEWNDIEAENERLIDDVAAMGQECIDLRLDNERLRAAILGLECDAEWCGKSPSKWGDGKCQVCKALAAVDND